MLALNVAYVNILSKNVKKDSTNNEPKFIIDNYVKLPYNIKMNGGSFFMQKLKEEVREKIMRAGARLFKAKGFDNTSMKDIAQSAEVSTGNIYRYFLTKHHLLSELQQEMEKELESFFQNIPISCEELNSEKAFKLIKDKVIELAKIKSEELDMMFKCVDQGLFKDFKNKMLEMFTEKFEKIAKNTGNGNGDKVLCGAMARSLFEGFYYIVRENVQDIEKLDRNLDAYYKLLLVDLDKRILGVLKNG